MEDLMLDKLAKELVEARERINALELVKQSLEDRLKRLEDRITEQPMEWWVVVRQDNGYPVQVYENKQAAKDCAGGREPVRVVAAPDADEKECWAIVITDCYTKGTSLVYDSVKRAEMYSEYNRGAVIKVKKA